MRGSGPTGRPSPSMSSQDETVLDIVGTGPAGDSLEPIRQAKGHGTSSEPTTTAPPAATFDQGDLSVQHPLGRVRIFAFGCTSCKGSRAILARPVRFRSGGIVSILTSLTSSEGCSLGGTMLPRSDRACNRF